MSFETFETIVYIFIISLAIYSLLTQKWAALTLLGLSKADGSILASDGLLNSGRLSTLHTGQLAGFVFSFLVTSSGRVIAFVSLRHNTNLHVIAIGDKSKLRRRLWSRRLTRLKLEGDFPDYFRMYCSKGHEQELLQLFDPADMAYFVDFCRAHDFELYKDMVYISRAQGAKQSGDSTTMVHDVENFLTKNQRLLNRIEGIKT